MIPGPNPGEVERGERWQIVDLPADVERLRGAAPRFRWAIGVDENAPAFQSAVA